MKGKNLFKRIATTGLAAAMVMSMGMPAFADTVDNVTVVNDTQIHKTITHEENTTPSNKSFTFEVAPGTKSGTQTASPVPSSVDSTTHQVTLNTTAGQAADTATIFSASDYSETGVYTYTISEVAGTSDNYWTYDNHSYAIEVKVTRDTNGNLQIAGVTAKRDDATDKTDSIAFENNYTAWGNDGGEEPSTKPTALTVNKHVKGDDSNPNDTFTFQITFTAPEGIDTTKVPTDSNGNTYKYGTVTGTENTFSLTGTGSLSFSIPAGVTYTVTETNNGGYQHTYISTSGDNDNGYGTTEKTSQNGSSVRNTSTTIDVRNTKEVTNVLTGVVNQYGGLLMIVAIAAAGIIVLSIRRRREA